jgi:hypothetical protein
VAELSPNAWSGAFENVDRSAPDAVSSMKQDLDNVNPET